jgi:hypothetical protein
MSTRGSNSENRSRWIGWRTAAQILADTAKGEPTKPSKPGFVGFVGALHAEYANILTLPGPKGASVTLPYIASGSGEQPIQVDLDCPTKTTRLMSWSEPKTAAAGWCGGVVPARAEA